MVFKVLGHVALILLSKSFFSNINNKLKKNYVKFQFDSTHYQNIIVNTCIVD